MHIDWAGLTIIIGGILFFLIILLGIFLQLKERKTATVLFPTTYGPVVDWGERYKEVEAKYGTNAIPLIYNTDYKKNITAMGNTYFKSDFHKIFSSDFNNKGNLNFPGPFYTFGTDTCGTGQPEAPHNILSDEDSREHVFRQPQTMKQLMSVFSAAAVDPYGAYAMDGNDHWTLSLIREWWGNKYTLIQQLSSQPLIQNQDATQAQEYIDYLNGEALLDLRKYAFFLKHKRYPMEEEVTDLPEIN